MTKSKTVRAGFTNDGVPANINIVRSLALCTFAAYRPWARNRDANCANSKPSYRNLVPKRRMKRPKPGAVELLEKIDVLRKRVSQNPVYRYLRPALQ